MTTIKITDHPKLQYKGRPIKRYLQRIENNYFSNKPDEGQIVAQVHIKHYGIEDDNSEVYLGEPLPDSEKILAEDIKTNITADNKNYVDGNTNERVQPDPETGEYPSNTYPEYDYWVLIVKNLPQGVTIFDLMAQQILLFASRGDFDNY